MPRPLTASRLLAFVQSYRAAIVDRFRDHEVAIERGRSRCASDGEDLLVAAFQSLRAPQLPLASNAQVEGVVAAMCSAHHGMPVVPYWIACRGLGFAVRAACQWASLTLEHALVDGQRIEWLVQRTRPMLDNQHLDPTRGGPWLDLRRAVACADGETYDEGRMAAAAIRDDAGPVVRCGLEFAFPSEPEWARRDAFHEIQCVPAYPKTCA